MEDYTTEKIKKKAKAKNYCQANKKNYKKDLESIIESLKIRKN